jgi:hypothetical protein
MGTQHGLLVPLLGACCWTGRRVYASLEFLGQVEWAQRAHREGFQKVEASIRDVPDTLQLVWQHAI